MRSSAKTSLQNFSLNSAQPTRSVPTADRIKTWARAGGICSFTGCRAELLAEDYLVGVIAHIVARSPLGPRGDELISLQGKQSYDNLILLCPNHHALVDKSRKDYSSSALRTMKREHEAWVQRCLSKGDPWETSMADVYYLNVPRLGLYAALNSIPFPELDLSGERPLHGLGSKVASVLEAFEDILKHMEVRAVRLNRALDLEAIEEGVIVAFDGSFRVRNFRVVPADPATFRLTGIPEKDPLVYQELGSIRFRCSLDPKWVTTSTAFGFFRRSQRMAGLAVIRRVDRRLGALVGTPLIIGIPKPKWLEELEDLGRLIEDA